MKILDLGCGTNKYKGKKGDKVIGLDKFKTPQTDVVWDLEKTPLKRNKKKIKNNYFDMVIANHTLEHIRNFEELMKELHRITKPNGIIKIRLPFWASFQAFDIDHERFFNYCSFELYEKKDKFHHMANNVEFKILKRRLIMSNNSKTNFLNALNPLINHFPKIYQRFFATLLPCDELYFELKVIK